MTEASTEQRTLNLGQILSRAEEEAPIFLEDSEPFEIDASLITTGRTCVIGSSGSGKSYAVGVICEELCKAGVPFAIIDVEGEYSGLKEKFEAVWVGDDEGCDLFWSKKLDLKRLASYAPDCPPIIFDLTEASRAKEKVNEFLIALYTVISRRRTPYLLILEEADRFSPQSGGERLPIIDEIARRGRKRGLGLMLCTQRPSLVDKNVLSQCSNQLIGKLVIKNDLNSVSQFFSSREQASALTALQPGEFYALGGFLPEPCKVKIRARETRHGGVTPKLGKVEVEPSIERLLESLQENNPVLARTEIVVPTVEVSIPNAPAAPVKISQVVDAAGEPEIGKEEVEELPMDDFLDWDTKKSLAVSGLSPLIEPESVPRLVKLEKSYKLFGQKENVTRVGLAFRPLLEVGVRIRSGVLKKKFETKYFLIDGVSAKRVQITDRLIYSEGLDRLMGLDEGEITALRALSPDRDQSAIEIASSTRRTEDETKALLRRLETRRLVRSSKLGRSKMYHRLVDVPKIDLSTESTMKLNELDASSGFKIAKLKVKEDLVREVVKGIWSGADMDTFKQIYYPVYLAELVLNAKKRYVWIDGRTGKEIEF